MFMKCAIVILILILINSTRLVVLQAAVGDYAWPPLLGNMDVSYSA